MIEKMKKLTLLIYHSSKEKFLENLQSQGVVHLEANRSAQNDQIIELKDKITIIRKGLTILNQVSSKERAILKQKEFTREVEELVKQIEDGSSILDELNNDLEVTKKQIRLLEAWGDFDPQNIDRLSEVGIRIRFYSIASSKFKDLEIEDVRIEKISEIKNMIYFVVFYREGENVLEINATEERIPIKSLKNLFSEKGKIIKNIDKQKNLILDLCSYSDYLKNIIISCEDDLEYKIAHASLEEEVDGKVMVITGWIPLEKYDQINTFLIKEDVAYIIDDPSLDDDVPVKLKNGPFARLFEPLTKMHSLPSYNEIDPTPFFAPFFAAFFGLCLADVGYGLILFVGAVVAFILLKKKSIRMILMLGIVLSLFTIGGGLVLNSFFGEKITEFTLLPSSIKRIVIFGNLNDAMAFSILLGIFQVLLGFVLQIVNRIRIHGTKGAFQPIGTMMLLIGVLIAALSSTNKPGSDPLNIGPIPISKFVGLIPNAGNVGIIAAAIGLVLILLFNNVNKKIFMRPILGLWELYGIVTGVPGDILSYIRVFALGLASGLLGNAFNKIAFMVGGGGSVGGYIGMILILLAGHSINIGLGALSAFVHPLRLVLLEFYNAVGYTGGGKMFSPFRNRIIKNKQGA